MQKKTTKKRGLVYLIAKVLQIGSVRVHDFDTVRLIPYHPIAKRIAFIPVGGGKVLVTDTYLPTWYDEGENDKGRKVSKTDLINEEQYVLVSAVKLVHAFRNGGTITRAKSSYGSAALVLERGKTHVAFRAPCGAYGTMTVGEADKLADAIEAL